MPTRSGAIDHASPVEWGHPLNRGLVGWWLPLAGRQGVELRDIAGRNPGTLTNGPTWVTGPHGFGSVRCASGASSYVALPDLSAYDGSAVASVEFALRRTVATPASDPSSGCFRFRAEDSNGNAHYPYTDGNLYLGVFNGNGVGRPISGFSDSGFDKSAWHHLLIVNRGTGGSDYRVYRNGVLLTSGTGLSSCTFGTAPYLGNSRVAGSLAGDLDFQSVRLYPARALSDSDVGRLYEQYLRGHPDTLRRLPGRIYAVTISGGGSTTGTLAVTLDALTASGAGDVGVTGTADVTLDAVTLSGAGSVDNSGTLAATLDDVTLAGVGSIPVAGTADVTLDDATASGAAGVSVDGTAALTLDDLTAASTATADVSVSLAGTLDDLAVAADGVVPAEGSLASSLEDCTGSGSGSPPVSGDTSGLLGDVTLVAAGSPTVSGTLAVTLDDATLSASDSGGTTGTTAVTLDDATASASGDVGNAATLAATLDDVSATSAVTVSADGSAATTLDDMAVVAVADVLSPATLAVTLGDITNKLGDVSVEVAGSLTVTLDAVILAASDATSGGSRPFLFFIF